MKAFIIIFLVAVAVVVAEDANKKPACGKHASFITKCGCGDLNCELRSFAAVLCTADCRDGCFCDEGYLRGPRGTCIRERKCPVCPANEHYEHCGTSCERTCENRDAMIKCSADCARKCFCDDDLVRDASGKCIARDQCPE